MGWSEANARFVAQLICCKNKATSFSNDMLKLIDDYNTNIKKRSSYDIVNNYQIKQGIINYFSTNDFFRNLSHGKDIIN